MVFLHWFTVLLQCKIQWLKCQHWICVESMVQIQWLKCQHWISIESMLFALFFIFFLDGGRGGGTPLLIPPLPPNHDWNDNIDSTFYPCSLPFSFIFFLLGGGGQPPPPPPPSSLPPPPPTNIDSMFIYDICLILFWRVREGGCLRLPSPPPPNFANPNLSCTLVRVSLPMEWM